MRNPKSEILGLLLAATVLSGCSSGAGKVGGGQVQQDRATQHVTTVVLVRKMSQVLYPLVTRQQGARGSTCPPSLSQPQRQPDGSYVQDVTYDNCVRDKKTQLPNGTVRTERQFPDGLLETTTQGRPQLLSLNPRTIRLSLEQSYTNGERVKYDYTRQDPAPLRNDALDDTEQVRGQLIYKSGQTQEFTVQRSDPRSNQRDVVDTTLLDGTRFTMTVALEARTSQVFWNADVTTLTKGSYSSGGQRVDFELRGAGANTWNEWTLTAPGGVTGRFALNPDFSGSGQFFRNGTLDSSISWDREGRASITLVSGEATTAGPSAAAVSFLAHAWRELVALGGPGPGAR